MLVRLTIVTLETKHSCNHTSDNGERSYDSVRQYFLVVDAESLLTIGPTPIPNTNSDNPSVDTSRDVWNLCSS